MARNKSHKEDEKVDVPMTPMIDVVFMLLIFFLLTFKIVIPEGDFSIRMPMAPPSETNVDIEEDQLTMVVGLRADSDGNLKRILVGETVLWPPSGSGVVAPRPIDADLGYKKLRGQMLDLAMEGGKISPEKAQAIEVDIDADTELKFMFVIEALTRVCGYTTDGPQGEPIIHRLVTKVRLKPPKAGF